MDEWVWSNGGMILTGENWSTRRKTLYSVGGRWMNEYGAMVEWYWQGKTEVLGEKHYTYSVGGRWMNEYGAMVEWYWQGKTEVLGEKHYRPWVVDEWMSMEQWWNDTDRGKLRCRERNLSYCKFFLSWIARSLAWNWTQASLKVDDIKTERLVEFIPMTT